ncbi:MAG: precorrin-6y C5,15-methyltransferase (decarboxylating) subunit CbiE [Actinobacteria bacterium]|nr:precorrin-6y C5,15-methyltransferase (decarboxylating) subunit CbiE [Actinomycetota bacterium]
MITVIGLDGSPLAPEAAKALASATLVAGGRRQLAAVAVPAGARTVVLGPLGPALDQLAGHQGEAVVLASGDPGFFGIVRALRERGLPSVVLPAASSVSLAFARAGLAWDDAMVVSAHGRELRQAVNVCRACRKTAVLTGPGAGPAEIGAALAGWERRLIVCERLGADDERVTECTPAEAAARSWDGPSVVLCLGGIAGSGPGWAWPRPPRGMAGGWGLAEDEFEHEGAVITKAEVRALALARLAPGPGALIWDVGAGAGTVAVECARLGAAVVAVERDPHRCTLIERNARRHGADVRVVAGSAPAALAGLPEPDAVFLGGGGPAVAAAVAELGPARIVAAVAAIERAGQVRSALAGAGYAVDGALVQASRLAPLPGEVHRLAAASPVFLLSGARR